MFSMDSMHGMHSSVSKTAGLFNHTKMTKSIIRNIQRICVQSCRFQSNVHIFNNKTKRIQRDRALSNPDSHIFDYLKDEIAYRVADRIFDIKRRFPLIVDLGTHKGLIGTNLTNETTDCIIHCSSSINSLKQIPSNNEIDIQKMCINEEDFNMRENSIDLVVSSLNLHWVNDLPTLFGNVFTSLKQDGVFIGAMFGGQTLYELRCSLQMAEMEREGGFGLHVSPFITAQDIGTLLNRAGFTLLTIDTDAIVVHYPTIFQLMYDIKGMAENNAMLNGRTHISRDSLLAAAAIYEYFYGKNENDIKNITTESNSAISATFDIFYFIGWKPHPSQPKPVERGSANFSFKDIANLEKSLKKK